jgi:hypothetical protein
MPERFLLETTWLHESYTMTVFIKTRLEIRWNTNIGNSAEFENAPIYTNTVEM